MKRWRMNRMGILNFWFYDEEVFELEDGRVLLRGANGSGKSVTMQSFVPLVLDGDKRPERLDSFGSRDRRLEYYLLGDTDNGHMDRTGYLWIEFYHEEKQLYKTIGIGLRARRGAAQMAFWGFLLEDGRRINQDFYLYDYPGWLETKKKVPLSRKALTDAIASGGIVVQEQAAYRDLVKKSIFGFKDNNDSYKDLLKLLLEIRSPKLSKEFRPSSIYSILTNALPALTDDELSDLSDVLQDMDQISERLEELQIQIEEVKNLDRYYGDYNKVLIYGYSLDLKVLNRTCNEHKKAFNDCRKELSCVTDRELEINGEITQIELEIMKIQSELDYLLQNENLEKPKELERLNTELRKMDDRYLVVSKRLTETQGRIQAWQKEMEEKRAIGGELLRNQENLIEDLESHARIMEFYEHDIYRRQWEQGDDYQLCADNWKQDLQNHQGELKKAVQVAEKEQELCSEMIKEKQRWGEFYKIRSGAEEACALAEVHFISCKEQLKECIVSWRQNLVQLAVDNEALGDILRALSDLNKDNRSYETVKSVVYDKVFDQKQQLTNVLLVLEQQGSGLEERRKLLQEELDLWKNKKEPEPGHSDQRSKCREERALQLGAPLYAVCDFADELSELEKAQIETTLEQAGILDAWILPGGKVGYFAEEKGEEMWIEPVKLTEGSTLLEVLRPSPSAECGLTQADINLVLSSFYWNKDFDSKQAVTDITGGSQIGKAGFKIGVLVGKNQAKEQAEYIGAVNRQKTKERIVAQLAIQIGEVQSQQDDIQGQIRIKNEELIILSTEKESFPDDNELQKRLDNLLSKTYQLQEAINQERIAEKQYHSVEILWKDQKMALEGITSAWIRLKTLNDLEDAMRSLNDYQILLVQLKTENVHYQSLQNDCQNYQQYIDEANEQVDDSEQDLAHIRVAKSLMDSQVSQLQVLIADLGLKEIVNKIENCNQTKEKLEHALPPLRKALLENGKQQGDLNRQLQTIQEKLQEVTEHLNEVIVRWKAEIELGLVSLAENNEYNPSEFQSVMRLVETFVTEYKAVWGKLNKEKVIGDLIAEFSKVNVNLREYVLEWETMENGRIIILSNRDRMNPMTPGQLLNELVAKENEQKLYLTEQDQKLYSEIIIGSVGKSIQLKIHQAFDWIDRMDQLMRQRNTTSGLKLSLKWVPMSQRSESELDTETLVQLLLSDNERLDDSEINKMIEHFRKRILLAKESAKEEQGSLRKYINQMLDYRTWFMFRLDFRKGEQSNYRELTDKRFNVLSGGEKAMAMYIPLFAAANSRYSEADTEAPKIIALDEAFAGVDDSNMRDMFELLTDMDFDYVMTSQVLWGCYDTVPSLAIYEIHRPKDIDIITLLHYRWNGKQKIYMEQ